MRFSGSAEMLRTSPLVARSQKRWYFPKPPLSCWNFGDSIIQDFDGSSETVAT